MKKFSLLIQLVLSFFLMIVLFLGIIGISYYQTTSAAIGRLTVQTTKSSISQGAEFVSSYIKKLLQTTKSLSHNQAVLEYLKSPEPSKEEALLFLMNSVLESDQDLVSAALVSKNGSLVSTDHNIDMKTSEDMMQEDWYQQAVHQQEMLPVLVPAHLKKLSKEQEDWVISVAQEISDTSGNNLAVLRLDISYGTLSRYLDHLELGEDGFTFILNESHEFVYHPEKKVYSSEEEMNRMKPYIRLTDGYTAKKQQYVYQHQIADSNWTLVGVASLQQLYALKHQILKTFLLLGCISLLICAAGIWFILQLWIRPIKNLQKIILAVSDGHHELRAEESGSAEIRDLAVQFNRMLDQIDQLLAEVRENEQSIRQYELRALSGQINPHFLYNTLDTIVWMAEFNDSQKVVDLTKSLARYFRIALNQGKDLISLKDELDHVRQYLFIQKERYGEKLNYEIEEIQHLDAFMIPKLTLQPLVENAIYHGIKEVKRNGLIRIQVSETDTHFLISIYDNGIGFDSSKKEHPQERKLHAGGIGMDNVNQRLRLHFGKNYEMKISSAPDQYTEILLLLPKQTGTP